MAAVAMEDKKKEMIEKTAQEFQKLNGDNQMFILGYMLGIQQISIHAPLTGSDRKYTHKIPL